MPKRKSFTLSALVTQVTERFLPDLHRNYVMQNLKSSEMYRSYNNFVPEYLRGRPRSVILHCLDRKSRGNKYDKDDIVPTEKTGVFKVMKRGNPKHTVDVLTPSCTCKDWVRWHIPCKHLFAVFGTQTEWGWAALPKSYTEGPYLQADETAIAEYFHQAEEEPLPSFGCDEADSVQPCEPANNSTISDIPETKVFAVTEAHNLTHSARTNIQYSY